MDESWFMMVAVFAPAHATVTVRQSSVDWWITAGHHHGHFHTHMTITQMDLSESWSSTGWRIRHGFLITRYSYTQYAEIVWAWNFLLIQRFSFILFILFYFF